MHLRLKMIWGSTATINKASSSKRNGESKQSSSSPIMKKFFFGRKTPKGMASKPKMMAKKKSLLLRKTILINGKQVPIKVLKRSSGPKSKEVSQQKIHVT